MIIIDLIFNLTLMIAISVVTGFIELRWKRNSLPGTLLQGLLFGTAGIVAMLRPYNVGPGMIIDGRSIMVSMCALFFGPWASTLAGLMIIGFRIYLGGTGMPTGVLLTTTSFAIGLAAYYSRRRKNESELKLGQLYIFGFVVHIVMLLTMLTLPGENAIYVLKTITVPVIVFFPAATVVIGKILTDQEKSARSLRALLDSEERFRTVVEQASDGIFIIDREGNFIDANPRCCAMLGYNRDELLSLSMSHIVPKNDLVKEPPKIKEASNGKTVLSERRLICKDGSILTMEISGRLQPDGTLQGIVRDISERKRAEEALRDSEKLLRSIIDSSTDYIYVKDRELRTLICNQTFSAALGKVPADLIGKTDIENGWDPEYVKGNPEKGIVGFEEDDRRALNGESIHTSEPSMINGKLHYFDTIKLPLRNEAGEITGVLGLSRDLTERVRAEQALSESEALLKEAQQIAHIGSWQYDVSRQVITWSEEIFRIFGLDPDNGEPAYDEHGKLMYPGDWEILDAAYRRALEEGVGYQLELRIVRPGGEIRNIRIICHVIKGEDGRANQLRGTIQGITEYMRLTEKMTRSQKLADLGTLAAGVAHEINSPLQVITGSSENILEKLKANGDFDREGMQRRMERINQNAWRIANIVRSLLAYARSPQDQIAPASLNSIVNDALLLIEHQIRVWYNVKVVTHLAKDLPDFTCDRNKIIQVIINLLTNARDAMPNGGTATLHTDFEPQTRRLVLQIKDTGHGIPESVKNRIFDPFFTTKPIGQGTGLGLSIVQGIVHSHGGEITVSSLPGKGTAFTIFFPLVPPALPEPPENGMDEFGMPR